jgi:hypothetical protein
MRAANPGARGHAQEHLWTVAPALMVMPKMVALEPIDAPLPTRDRRRVGFRPVTCHYVFPPDGVRVRPAEGRTDETGKVFGRADYRRVEGA